MRHVVRGSWLIAFLLASALPIAAQANMALKVDGDDSALFVPSDPSLEPPNALTIEAWVKGEGSVSHGRIIRKEAGTGYLLSWSFQGNQISGLVICGNWKAAYDPLPNSTYLNEWHHLAMTTQLGGQITLYVDGVNVDSTSAPSNFCHSGDLWIGSWGTVEEFIGEIDNVRLWNVVRTEDEIRDSMLLTIDEAPGLVSSWYMDGDGLDSTSQNHGSLFGNAVFVPSTAPLGFEVQPARASWLGGDEVHLVGGSFAGFTEPPEVMFGSARSPRVLLLDDMTLNAVVPRAMAPGEQVTVFVDGDGLQASSSSLFTYTPRLDAALLDDGRTEVQLAIDPPAQVRIMVGTPLANSAMSPGPAWHLELQPLLRGFSGTALLPDELAVWIPALDHPLLIGQPVAYQALITPLPGGVETYSNTVIVSDDSGNESAER